MSRADCELGSVRFGSVRARFGSTRTVNEPSRARFLGSFGKRAELEPAKARLGSITALLDAHIFDKFTKRTSLSNRNSQSDDCSCLCLSK